MPTAEPPLRVLITNRVLAHRTGTELYVRDLAAALLARGHAPVVYTPLPGQLAEEVRALTVPVVDDLRRMGAAPDVIHGHHALETLTALLAFPRVPAVGFSHAWVGWADAPLRFPRVLRYVAVDGTCADRLVAEHGIDPARVRVVLNWADLERFRPRPPLPARPRRALVFSNNAGAGDRHLHAIRQACAAAGVSVDVAGARAGAAARAPEALLGGYDVVFAKARAAIEAMAVGAAVVLCDEAGAGPMVTTHQLDRLRALNFGRRVLCDPATPEHLAAQLARYDAADAAEVSRRIRACAGRDAAVDELVGLYREVVGEHRGATDDPDAERRATAEYLRELAPRMWERDMLRGGVRRLFRVPGIGALLRARAARQAPSRGLPQLLRFTQDD